MTQFKFEKLLIWQRSMDLGESIHSIIKGFPENEKFNLSNQILRSNDSIALNIAEGSIGQSNPEQNKFMGYAIRSLAETVTCLHKSYRRNYIKVEKFQLLYDECYHLMNMMIAFQKTLKR